REIIVADAPQPRPGAHRVLAEAPGRDVVDLEPVFVGVGVPDRRPSSGEGLQYLDRGRRVVAVPAPLLTVEQDTRLVHDPSGEYRGVGELEGVLPGRGDVGPLG